MSLDVSVLQHSVRRKKGLLDKLGDAGRFLGDLIQGGEVSIARVEHQIGELERYSATCFDQIDEVGESWQKTERHLAEIKGKLKQASRAARSALLAQAEILLRECDGYQGAIDKLKSNGLASRVLVEKLRDLLILISGPMTEDSIDLWTTQLEGSIDEGAMRKKALDELEKTSERAASKVEEQLSPEEVESQLESLSSQESQTSRDHAVEQKLEELFDE